VRNIDSRIEERPAKVSDSTIGIKIADGSYYPVLEKGFTGRKKLTVTTVKDNQEKVQIDLYRGNGGSVEQPSYIGSLIVENIPPAPQGEPEIELLLGINPEGELSAEASDRRTGESQKFSTTLTRLAPGELAESPEFEVEEEEVPTVSSSSFEEPPITGESYKVTETDRRRETVERGERRGPNLLLLILFVLLGVLLVAAIAYFVYRSVRGPETSPLSARGTTPPTAVVPEQPAPAAPAPAAPAPAAPAAAAGTSTQQPGAQQQQGSGGQATSKTAAAEAATVAKGGVTYRIKRGDTLWDISATYYRNPWLYHKLARANSIRNPDLIFAGSRIYIPEN
jgi:LysM repeat protein